jgi:predicted lipoprotein with Yx(FWY)xxD motif
LNEAALRYVKGDVPKLMFVRSARRGVRNPSPERGVRRHEHHSRLEWRKKMRIGWLAGPASAAAIVMLAACGSSGGGGTNTSAPAGGSGSSSSSAAQAAPAGPSSVVVKIKKTGAGMVLTNASGFTLYTFAADNGSTSTCYGKCAQFWPPVFGSAHLASAQNLHGKFGTTTRKDGKTQVTYAGHPLYTYAGDTKPGDTNGNNLDQDGGLWKVITTAVGGGAGAGSSGGTTPSPAPSASSGGGGGGYGY